MKLPPPERRDRGEPVAPLINIVFLLLIFFLMTATLAPPDPLTVTPPESTAPDDPARRESLLITADGILVYGAARGDAALDAVGTGGSLSVKSDAATRASRVVDVLLQLRERGIDDIDLLLEAR